LYNAYYFIIENTVELVLISIESNVHYKEKTFYKTWQTISYAINNTGCYLNPNPHCSYGVKNKTTQQMNGRKTECHPCTTKPPGK